MSCLWGEKEQKAVPLTKPENLYYNVWVNSLSDKFGLTMDSLVYMVYICINYMVSVVSVSLAKMVSMARQN